MSDGSDLTDGFERFDRARSAIPGDIKDALRRRGVDPAIVGGLSAEEINGVIRDMGLGGNTSTGDPTDMRGDAGTHEDKYAGSHRDSHTDMMYAGSHGDGIRHSDYAAFHSDYHADSSVVHIDRAGGSNPNHTDGNVHTDRVHPGPAHTDQGQHADSHGDYTDRSHVDHSVHTDYVDKPRRIERHNDFTDYTNYGGFPDT